MLALWLLFAASASAGRVDPDSMRGRLRELVKSMRNTHGGPAYISTAALKEASEAAERMLPEDDEVEDEERYDAACAWLMSQPRALGPMS